MFKNYFKLAVRNIFKNGIYSVINITGLAIGLASFIMILLYLNYELSYDTWDVSLKKVYKLGIQQKDGGDWGGNTPAPLGDFLKTNYPDVEDATALNPAGDFEMLMATGNKKIYQKGFVEIDSSFLKVFPYTLVQGNAATSLNLPGSVLISEEVSKKLFGNDNPVGKTIKFYNMFDGMVTGVFKQPATPSQLYAEVLYHPPYAQSNMFWQNYSYQTYIKLKHTVSHEQLETAINKIFYTEHIKKDKASYEDYKRNGEQMQLFADKLSSLHNFPRNGGGSFTTITVLLILAALLLIIGAINFSNLSIAASIRRAKEVGMRKVLGSSRSLLFWQFIGETAIQSIISLAVALFLVSLALPKFYESFGIQLILFKSNNINIFFQIIICLMIVILLSGLYPSAFLTRFNTTKVLKGDYSQGKKGMGFRNSLIVVQFVLSAFFVFITLVIQKQMHFMQTKDKGFSSEQVMRIEATQNTRDKMFAAVRNTLLNIPGVEYVSKTTNVPGDVHVDTGKNIFKYEGKEIKMNSVKVSADYFKTLNIALLKGRMFDGRTIDENTRTAVINETAEKQMNTKDATGKFISFYGCDSIPVQIVGVVKDFNIQNLSNIVQPAVYTIGNNACEFRSGGAMLVKLNGDNLPKTIAGIEQAWKNIEPDFPVRYSFLNDNFKKLYASYKRTQQIITFFTIIAIVISVMGLFALTAFLAKERTKEIGIRKILGAGVKDITVMMGKDFAKLIVIAVLIALPAGWLASYKWLQTFAYRTNINLVLFIVTAVIVFAIAFITISFQSIKSANANPVDNLRTE